MTSAASPSYDERQFEAVYEQYFGLLVQISVFKFRVPETEAEGLTHDVLISYLRKSATVLDLRSWLIGAICYASRHYWRLNGRNVATDDEADFNRADPASLRILDSLPDQLAAREALECLTPRCQKVLQMRYFEGCTIAEVATHFGVKTKSAQKLITKCLRRAERLYSEKGRAK
ncbi:MAG TPA: sigma-70 family RNA polymerase sigma factor [Thermoanaerobaculia bacterium]|jgi:RNA polymerase sigma factor (sigma-70 family)|nr:sigma-70 family RNA polymerase sigma factor [Thermoanaerobaculia bacterium]